MTDYNKLTVAKLKEVLKERNLPISGLKAALVARLNEDDAEGSAETKNESDEAPPVEPEALAEETTEVPVAEASTIAQSFPGESDAPVVAASVDEATPVESAEGALQKKEDIFEEQPKSIVLTKLYKLDKYVRPQSIYK